MASFFIPLTGLSADSTALNTIANDLSNMNTTAYKSQSTNFSDLFYQQVGSTGAGDPIQVGGGAQVASNSTDFTQGSFNTSGTSDSDVAINGNGFFVLNNGGSYLYTRDGTFTQDTNGNLITANGLDVMGYPAVNGVVNTNAPLTAINIPPNGQVQRPQPTTTMSMTANLDSTTPTTGSNASYPAQMTVYDSLGEPQILTVNFTNNGGGNWGYSASLAGSTSAPVTGTLTFDSNGTLTSTDPVTLGFTGLSDGASPMSIQWNLQGTNGPTITQVNSDSSVTTDQNGYPSGTCNGFTVGSDGTVMATYSNGKSEAVGQLALANVTNLQGLQLEGNDEYATTLESGAATIGAAGTGGLGAIKDSALEQSNVNISAEFSDLIIAQRAFEANAKSITTFDTVTQDTINMVH